MCVKAVKTSLEYIQLFYEFLSKKSSIILKILNKSLKVVNVILCGLSIFQSPIFLKRTVTPVFLPTGSGISLLL
jgi:hypothetical protein